jgi:hypothetical protein
MWSDEMDKKIRDAAENDIQNYQEKDWNGMEVLLDKHLPQKKRRRGIIVFFLLAALTATGYLLVDSVSSSRQTVSQEQEITSPESGSNTNSSANKTAEKTQPVSQEQTKNDSRTITRSIENPIPKKELTATRTSTEKINSGSVNTTVTANRNYTVPKTIKSNLNSRTKDLIKQPVIVNRDNITKNGRPLERQKNQHPINDVAATDKNSTPATNGKNNNDIQNVAPTTDDQQTLPSTYPATAQNDKVTKQPAVPENKETKSEPVAATNKPAKKERAPKSFISRLSFTASAGPDYSSVKFKYSGQVKLNYGIGVSYAINDRFSLRTGFYAGSKVYSADSNSYHTPYTGGPYSYKLHAVDADCFVYEVPVNLVYSFKGTKNHNFFASAGLSSYFMKKEDYVYTYISPSGQKYTHLWQFRNENKHPFSIVSLSAGYQYNFSKRFSLLAEPYVKLPIGGVGDGKVMLNNTGVLFTAAWKPFGKK